MQNAKWRRLTVLAVGLLLCSAAWSESVNFQGKTYSVTVVPLASNVPLSGACDLIFIQAETGEKYLTLPVDATLRGDFDNAEGKHRYYVLDRFTGQINAFATLDGTLINLDGTFFNSTTQSPVFPQNPLESISKPLTIPSTESPVDVSIVDEELFGYRTDGPQADLPHVYAITRNSSSVVQESFAVPLVNGDPAGGNGAVFLEYDAETDNHLLVQIELDPNLNTDLRDRISAFSRDGVLVSQLILDNNTAFPNYSGFAAGITLDPSTGIIYLLDSNARQIFVIAPRRPAIFSLTPASGDTAGGTAVVIAGVNLPQDAKVFFDGIAANGISVAGNGSSITATTPPHAVGAVNVTVTGTDIPAATPLTLTGAFSYVNTLPSATLVASPTQGPAPLVVSFVVTASDADGAIVERVINFGDGSSFTFPADFAVVSTAHTYAAEGTYTARLTVTDNQGGQKKSDQVIIVGEGADLVLRSLSFKADAASKSGTRDAMKFKGEIVLPDNIDLALADVTVGFVNPAAAALIPCTDVGIFMEIPRVNKQTQQQIVGGGEYCSQFPESTRIRSGIINFDLKPLTKKGAQPNTYAISFQGSGESLALALEGSVVNLKLHEDDTPLTASELVETRQGKVEIVVRLETEFGETLQYRKIAVVQIRGGNEKAAKIQLKRR